MKNRSMLIAALVVACAALASVAGAATEDAAPADAGDTGTRMISFLKHLEVIGGISAGWFYASHPDPGAPEDEPLLSNVLIGLEDTDDSAPVGFKAGFGETSTPSVLTPPEVNRDFRIEFASAALRPVPHAELAAGLLQPIAGYEDTYTYNNRNIVHGIVAAQQPYNAYGARAAYSIAGLELHLGYYAKRLDEVEYAVDRDGDGENDRTAGRSWEIDAGGKAAGLSYCAYHYHVEGLRNLTGAVLEYTIGNVYLALNADYWRWDASLSDFYERSHAEGVALYVVPTFGRFSLPTRLEYVDQGGSRFYVDDPATSRLWSATVTPTVRWTEKAYLRGEASYVHAKKAFAEGDGDTKSSRVYLAGELGYVF